MGQVKIQIKHGSNTKCIKANMGQIQIQIWVKFKSFGELSQAEIGLCARHQCSLECTLKCFSGCSEIEILHKYKQLGKSGRYLLENICSWPHLSASAYSILTTSTCNGPAIQVITRRSQILDRLWENRFQFPIKGNSHETITGLFGIFPKWTPSPGIGYLFLMHIQLPLLQPDLFRSRSNGFLNKQIH